MEKSCGLTCKRIENGQVECTTTAGSFVRFWPNEVSNVMAKPFYSPESYNNFEGHDILILSNNGNKQRIYTNKRFCNGIGDLFKKMQTKK